MKEKMLMTFNGLNSNFENQGFDYMTLDASTRHIVQENTAEIKSLMKRTAQDIINIGQMLLETKEKLSHGHFEAWLKSEFDWGQWTARKFMQVSRQFKSVNFTDLSIDASALYLLAAPSTSEPVRQVALERARQGETITHAKVKAITSCYKELDNSQTSKPFTIDVPAVPVKQESSTLAEPLPVSQVVEAENTTLVKPPEEPLPEQDIATPAHFQLRNFSHSLATAADRGYYPLENPALGKIQSLFEVGNLLRVTGFEQQTCQWLGEVAKVTEVTDNNIEVVVKISLQPSTG